MKYLIIDIETTGLDPLNHQILEFACILDDTDKWTTPLEDMPSLQYILDPRTPSMLHIQGDPFALQMNAELLKIIAGGGGINERTFRQYLHSFLAKHHDISQGRFKLNVAGKNVAGFDLPFLRQLSAWNDVVVTRQRVLDPAILFMKPDDRKLPNLQKCMQRTGIDIPVTHRALADCLDTGMLLRYGLNDLWGGVRK